MRGWTRVKVYTSKAPTTHKIGRPTLRRHSSMRARMPTTPMASRKGSLAARRDSLMIRSALNA